MEIAELNRQLSEIGPHDPTVREDVARRAATIRSGFGLEKPADGEEVFQYVQTLEILRDVGMETRFDVPKLLEYGRQAVQYYRRIKDYPRLGRALQAFANTCRVAQDDKTAKTATAWANYILTEKCSVHEPRVVQLRHQSTFWALRLSVQDSESGSQEEKDQLAQLLRSAEDVNTPAIWLETHRELTGYWTIRENLEEASEHYRQLQMLESNPELPTYGRPTRFRPLIEYLLVTRKPSDKDLALQLITSTYVEMYRKDRHLYYYNQLKKWRAQFRLTLELPKPLYASPILVHLPRG